MLVDENLVRVKIAEVEKKSEARRHYLKKTAQVGDETKTQRYLRLENFQPWKLQIGFWKEVNLCRTMFRQHVLGMSKWTWLILCIRNMNLVEASRN